MNARTETIKKTAEFLTIWGFPVASEKVLSEEISVVVSAEWMINKMRSDGAIDFWSKVLGLGKQWEC